MATKSDFVHLFEQTDESYRGIHPGSDGQGDNWQIWYTHWLLDVSDLPELLGFKPKPEKLQKILLDLHRQYPDMNPTISWPKYMGGQLFQVFLTKPSAE